MPQIKSVLLDFNPWWKGPFKVEYKDREIYAQIKKYIPLRQIIALTGLRRVGKTTLLMKVASDAIAEGFDPKDVIYFSFDEFKGVELRDVLSASEELLERDSSSSRTLFLLDEVQKLGEWENQAKALYDLHPRMKIMISGSKSFFIERKSRATLAGGIYEFRVEPLTFKEYLDFKGVYLPPPGLYPRELKRIFGEYMTTQGFPELVGVHDKDIIRKYIKESIVEKVLYRDIPQLYRVKQIAILEGLLGVLMDEPGQMIDLASLGRDLNITRQTLSLYLRYLEESYLIRKLYNYSKNRRKIERKLKKLYPTIQSPDLLFRDDDQARSKAFECSVVNQLRAEYFWRDPYKNEVDVVQDGTSPLPIEIKYGKIETAGVTAFMKKHKISEGMIISRDKEFVHEENGQKIRVVPAYKHFLSTDHDRTKEGPR
ncbi:MAG: ATP-binding protein [Candidatus Aminicenantales bacterium]